MDKRVSDQAWLDIFEQRSVICRVIDDEGITRAFTPDNPDQLWSRVLITALNEHVRGHFANELLHFIGSGKSKARYTCNACKTIVKFGDALQFQEPFIVEFEMIGDKQ